MFLDAGSGFGRICLYAAMYYEFDVVRGVEAVGVYHDQAQGFLNESKLFAEQQFWNREKTKIEFIHDDFLDSDWSDVTVLFIDDRKFSREYNYLWMRKAERELKPGAWVITHEFCIPSSKFLQLRGGVRHEVGLGGVGWGGMGRERLDVWGGGEGRASQSPDYGSTSPSLPPPSPNT